MKRFLISNLRLGQLALFACAACCASAQHHEVKAIYRISNQPTGTYRESESTTQQGDTETTIISTFIFNRLGVKLEMKSSSQVREDKQGRFLGLTSDISSSKQSTHMVVTAGETSLAIRMSVGDKTYDRSLAYKGSLLGPEAARKLVLSQLHSVGDLASYQTFSGELGAVVTITDKLIELGPVKVGDKPLAGMKLEETLSAMPGKSTVWLDSEGWLMSKTTPSPLGEIVASRSTGSDDTAASKGAVLPSEMFINTTVTSNIRLPQERLIDEIKLKLTHKRPDLGWPDFSAPNQTVLKKTRDTLVLRITRPQPGSRGVRPAISTDVTKPYLAPNALLQSDDPTVRAIAARVVKPTDDSWSAVRALQRWTNDNMHFDLGVAIVPASEVAKNKGGTCLGYSVLLGSLARAAGIPSRVRMGFVYAGGIWGGHAWVDVLIGNKWIPVDAALYGPGPADAARLSCFTGSLEEGMITNMGGLSQLFGNVDVKILEYTVGGKRTVVAADAKPYTITGNTYHNPWLGFSITKPAGFHFTSTNLTWPQTTLVAMEGSNHRRIEVRDESASLPARPDAKLLREAGMSGPILEHRLGNRTVSISRLGSKAALIFHSQGSTWLIVATCNSAEREVTKIYSSIRLEDAEVVRTAEGQASAR